MFDQAFMKTVQVKKVVGGDFPSKIFYEVWSDGPEKKDDHWLISRTLTKKDREGRGLFVTFRCAKVWVPPTGDDMEYSEVQVAQRVIAGHKSFKHLRVTMGFAQIHLTYSPTATLSTATDDAISVYERKHSAVVFELERDSRTSLPVKRLLAHAVVQIDWPDKAEE
jgi:hypothetical protein